MHHWKISWFPALANCKAYICFILVCVPFAHVQSKCERYWCDEMNKPFELADRRFTVTVTAKKVYADYEIRDMTIRYVSVQGAAIHL